MRVPFAYIADLFFFFNDTATTEIYTLSYTTLFRSVLQFSTLSFDSSLIDIFPTLVSGAELVVPTEDQRRDPLQLLALIRGQRLSHAFLPPALLSILPL